LSNPTKFEPFEKGKFEIVRIGGMTIGRAIYDPGLEMVLTCRPGYRRVDLLG